MLFNKCNSKKKVKKCSAVPKIINLPMQQTNFKLPRVLQPTQLLKIAIQSVIIKFWKHFLVHSKLFEISNFLVFVLILAIDNLMLEVTEKTLSYFEM